MATKRMSTDFVKFIGAVEDEWQLYSDNHEDYTVGRPIGFGASSVVYQAEYRPPTGEPIQCALKVMDLDSLSSSSLSLLQRETQLMSLSKHPNVLRVRGTWIEGHKLYIAMRLMRSGSAADVMHYGWTDGVEEDVAKCILKQALEGLNYLHINGFIHRDIKAANLLIDDDGTVLLGDLGVAVALHDEEISTTKKVISPEPTDKAQMVPLPAGARKSTTLRKRKSFVGTPCWMAPEVISQRSYDSKADIWSLGITALELAQGRPPRSRESPQKALLKTVQDDPPSFDRRAAKFKYSKAFDEFVQSCLKKNPNERPTAAELLQLPFFKNVKKTSFLVGTLLNGLPPLVDRQERRRVPSSISHNSVSSWDFPTIGITSQKTLLRASLDAEVFEMDETPEMTPAVKDGLPDSITPSLQYNPEEEDSVPGESSNESSPSTSPPSSYQGQSNMLKYAESTHLASSLPSSYRRGSSGSSASPRLWQKLKGLGSKIVDREPKPR